MSPVSSKHTSLPSRRQRSWPAATLLLIVTMLLAGAATALAAQGTTRDDRVVATPRLAVAEAAAAAPTIDGRLDDAAWSGAAPVAGFVQREPLEGAAPTAQTEVRVLYDADALYVGVRALDPAPDSIVGRLTRRDEWSPSDWLVVSIDSYDDRRTAFEFWLNPAGVERDAYRFNDVEVDFAWDAVWESAAFIDREGWSAEFRIPFSQLRFSNAGDGRWGFNVWREIQRLSETDVWTPIPRNGAGWVSHYGTLANVVTDGSARRIEVLPYALSQSIVRSGAETSPVNGPTDLGGTLGADFTIGLPLGLSLTTTVNPDFGQVEADPSTVNLTAFESFFQEKRPFFLEGAGIFRAPLAGPGDFEQLFYSRRIGRAPQGGADARGGYVSAPTRTRILGAAKLSGKTDGGWSIGVLDAVTAAEQALVVDSVGGRHHDLVEPATNYSVVRLQRDFREGRSAIGGILTTVNRSGAGDALSLHSAAYVWGVDARHRWFSNRWELSGNVATSYVRGSPNVIAQTQRSSTHYFQRPDADYLGVDSTRGTLGGTSGSLALSKIGGGHTRGSVRVNWVSPEFEVNDLGFQTQADLVESIVRLAYLEFQPGPLFREYSLQLNGLAGMDFGGDRLRSRVWGNAEVIFLNYWDVWLGGAYWLPEYDTRALRGGPTLLVPARRVIWGGLQSDTRRSASFQFGVWTNANGHGGGQGEVWLDFTWQPRDNARITLGPSLRGYGNDAQYVTSGSVAGETRYVTGALHQRTAALTARLDWTFAPNLSLQFYAQPFVSAGDYDAFRLVTDPRAERYIDRFDPLGADRLRRDGTTYLVDADADGGSDLTFEDPRFTVRDFRSTVVLRWEYLSGSTLFLVWSQNRSSSDQSGVFRPGSDLFGALGAPGENVFLLKVNYYLTP